jgi:uncharacterized ferredoxin-like protein
MSVADLMVNAAKTAPKGSGKDTVVAGILTGEEKDKLVKIMKELGEEYNQEFIIRDAKNVDSSICVVLIGCKDIPFGLQHCGMCGFDDCAEMKRAGANCVFNITDLGIAIGSAVSVAADNRVDNRVMYSAGIAAVKMECFQGNIKICYGIPLNTSSKSIYFDRNPSAVLL